MAIATLVVSGISVIVAVLTWSSTRQIAFVQQWNTLVTEYRSHEFGAAVRAVCDFFVNDCDSQIACVQSTYIKRRDSEQNLPIKDTLNFSRRMLAQYYWQLWVCVKNGFPFANKWITKYFNKNEMNIMAIIYQMCACEDSFYTSLWLNKSGHKASCEEQYEIKACIRKLHVRFGKVFKKDSRIAQPLDPRNAVEKSGKSNDTLEENIDERRIEIMGKDLFFTNGGKIVHFAYTVKDGIKPVNVTKNPDSNSFKNDSTAECVLFSSAVTAIAQSAFENCTELQIVEWIEDGQNGKASESEEHKDENQSSDKDNGNLTVQYHAFKNCDKLHTVVFPKVNAKDDPDSKDKKNPKYGKITIEKEAFIGCRELRTVVFPSNGSFDIADDAFSGCDTDRLVFVVTSSSSAERYAREHGFRWVEYVD